MSEVKLPTLEEMLAAGVHFGHTTGRWHPKMKPFLFGHRSGVHLIDLAKTRERLAAAAAFVENLTSEGKTILFVAIKPLAREVAAAEAVRAGSPYMVNRWIGGTLTNWPAVSGMLKRMRQIEDDQAAGKLEKYTKKEQLDFSQEKEKLEEVVGGLRLLKVLPAALFVVDAKYDKTAVAEANRLGIPVIGIVDSNINPGKINYPIPANDDALKSIGLITHVIADAVIAGRERVVAAAEATTKGGVFAPLNNSQISK